MIDSCYIWSNEHRAWWRPNELGYTPLIGEAGVYPLARAVQICGVALYGSRPPVMNEIPVRCMDIEKIMDGALLPDYSQFVGKPKP